MTRPSRCFTILLLLSFAPLFIACSGDDGNPESTSGQEEFERAPVFTLDQEFHIAEFGEDGLFGLVSQVVAAPDGNILVADRRLAQLHQFRPDGSYAGLVGRQGAGPGEFRGLNHIMMTDSGELFINDARLMRISSFIGSGDSWSPDQTHEAPSLGREGLSQIGELVTLRALYPAENGFIGEFMNLMGFDDTDTLTSCFQPLDESFRMVPDAEVLCMELMKNLVHVSGSVVTPRNIPEGHRSHFAVASKGEVVRIHTSEPRVTFNHTDGSLVNEFTFHAAHIPITDEIKQQLAQEALPEPSESPFSRSDFVDAIPDYKGYAEQMLIDNSQRVWILSRTGKEKHTWLVYSRDGELLALAEHPGGDFTHISNGRAYAAFNPGEDDPSFAVYSFGL